MYRVKEILLLLIVIIAVLNVIKLISMIIYKIARLIINIYTIQLKLTKEQKKSELWNLK